MRRNLDLALSIDKQSTEPIYRQVSNCLRRSIESGNIQAGTKLPSTTALGQSLGVNRLTIVRAYEDLAAAGLITTRSGAGSFVSDRVLKRRQLLEHSEKVMSDRRKQQLSDFASQILTDSSLVNSASESNKFNYGAPSIDMVPGAIWKKLLLEQCQNITLNRLDATPEPFGLFACRKAIAEYLGRSKGLRCSPEQVIVFSGSQQPLNYIANILCRPGDVVAIENPSYTGALNDYAFRHTEIAEIPVDYDGLLVSHLMALSDVKLVYTTPGYQDPTGIIMSLARRKELLNWAGAVDALIVEDGWDSEYCYTTTNLPALQGLDQTDSVFYVYSFWKLLYPLLTISVLVVPPQFIEVFELAKTLTECQFSLLEQQTLATFIEDGHLEKHLVKTKRIYSSRRKTLIDVLAGFLRKRVEIPKQSAGLHLCVRFEQNCDAQKIEDAAKQSSLPLISTKAFYRKKSVPNEYIIPFALLSEDELRQRGSDFCLKFP